MTDMTQEEVLAQLKTRGFEDGFQRTPLREFWGKLDSITGSMIERFQPPRLEVTYNFSELEVIEATEAYPFPIAQIPVMHSNRKQSAMGILGASIDRIINVDVPDEAQEGFKGQDYLIGKRTHWKMTGGHMMWDGKTKTEVARECWEVVEVEGEAAEPVMPVQSTPITPTPAAKPTGKVTSITEALRLLDGKTDQQFFQAAFVNPTIKADGKLVTQIVNRQFLGPLVEAGQFTVDESGVYHKAT
jgi:hypothetical protein